MEIKFDLKFNKNQQVFFIEKDSSIITIAKIDGFLIETLAGNYTVYKYKLYYYKLDGVYSSCTLDEIQLFASINEAYEYYMKNNKSRYEK